MGVTYNKIASKIATGRYTIENEHIYIYTALNEWNKSLQASTCLCHIHGYCMYMAIICNIPLPVGAGFSVLISNSFFRKRLALCRCGFSENTWRERGHAHIAKQK